MFLGSSISSNSMTVTDNLGNTIPYNIDVTNNYIYLQNLYKVLV